MEAVCIYFGMLARIEIQSSAKRPWRPMVVGEHVEDREI